MWQKDWKKKQWENNMIIKEAQSYCGIMNMKNAETAGS